MLIRFFLLFACVFLVHSSVSEARGRRSRVCVGCSTPARVMPRQGCVGCGTSVGMMASQGCVGCGTSVRVMPSQGCVGCGTQSRVSPQSNCVGCGTQPGSSFQGGNGNLDLQAAPAPSGDGGTGGTIQVTGRGHNRSGVGANGEALNDLLLMSGQPLAGRGSDGVFRDIVINDGRVGFVSNGSWQEFPASTSSQVVSLVKGHSGLSSSSLGRAILGQGGVVSPAPEGQGPAPEGTVPAPQPEGTQPAAGGDPVTLASQVNGLQFGVAGGRSLNNVLLERGQPIKGRGSDGFFRPIQVRPDGHIGFWGQRGWEEFPETTRSELVSHLQASGRTSEPAFAWLSGGNGAVPGPGPQGSPEGDHGPETEGPAEPGRPQSTQGTTLATLQEGAPWETLGSVVMKVSGGKYLVCNGVHGKCRLTDGETQASELISKWSKEPAAPADPENPTEEEQAAAKQREQMAHIFNAVFDPNAELKDPQGRPLAYGDAQTLEGQLREVAANPEGMMKLFEQWINSEEALSALLNKMFREADGLTDDQKHWMRAMIYAKRSAYVKNRMAEVVKRLSENPGQPADPRLRLISRMLTGKDGYTDRVTQAYGGFIAQELSGTGEFADQCPACSTLGTAHTLLVQDFVGEKKYWYRGSQSEGTTSLGPVAIHDGKAVAVFFGSDGSLMVRDGLTGQPSVVDRTNADHKAILEATQGYYQSHLSEYDTSDKPRVQRFLAWAQGTPERAPAQQRDEQPQPQPQAPQPPSTTASKPAIRIEIIGNTIGCPRCVQFDQALGSLSQFPAGAVTHFQYDSLSPTVRSRLGHFQFPRVVILTPDNQVLAKYEGNAAVSAVATIRQRLVNQK